MPVIHLDEQQFALTRETTRIGSGPGVDIAVPGEAAHGVEALIVLAGDGSASIRRARDDAAVRVNGIALGAGPTPLIHGDKVDVGGRELRYAEDQKAGATQFLSASELAHMAGSRKGGPARATAATGGRLVSLVDGKEYAIGDGGVVLGRDASCEVVVPLPEVSRRHAQIVPGDDGYVITDMSTNGVLVNGERIQGSRLLMRADVIRVGSEEFRFYADVVPPAPGGPGVPLAVPSLAATGMLPAVPRGPGGPTAQAPGPAAAPARPAPGPTAPPAPQAAVAPVVPGEAPSAPRAAPRPPAPRPAPAPPEPTSQGSSRLSWILLLLLVVVGAFLVLR